ncbi:hypothetical protein CRUP_025479, partial [Coryphaenoides rupestris]
MGIQDMYCKVDGSVNLMNVTRALFNGLAKQGGARAEPEPDDLISDRRLHWADVRVKQGSKRSHWATVKHTI